MSDKETVAQMLRRLEDENRRSLCYLCEEALGERYCRKPGRICKPAWLALADRIEAEQRVIIDAQDGSAHKIMRAWAEQRGYKWNDGESITQWLDSRFLRLPLVDGKPLARGMVLEGMNSPVDRFRILSDGSGAALDRSGIVIASIPPFCSSNRDDTLHLAKPKVLDADGTPTEKGDTVWALDSGQAYEVVEFANRAAGLVQCRSLETGECEDIDAKNLTHKEPDTQEKIDADALKGYWEYWGCSGICCSGCPALLDSKKPNERYGTECCSHSRTLDLLRRQRELDERLMVGGPW